ncbi:MAG: endo alpha-1,4 polygalactosaminidase [Deltaproteobacteria bacterium]|nr:endo alpha-1,4 polygalactosaminidase [Deltaproteobacteria bacterium]
MRPRLLFAALLLPACAPYVEATLGPLPLEEVRTFGYQIEAVDWGRSWGPLTHSRYDLLVLEPTRTDFSSDARDFDIGALVDDLQGSAGGDGAHRKLVVAYLDIGEAEDWRWYWTWSRGWDGAGDPPADWPEWIVAPDPDGWEGNYPVAYWDPEWKDIIIRGEDHDSGDGYGSAIEEAIQDGFDGIYLDWVEAFEDEDVAERAAAEGLDPAEEMIAFIGEMRAWARARDPEFLIIQQNAASLVQGHPELFEVIDAIAQEAIWFDGIATDDWSEPEGHDLENDRDLIDEYLGFLDQYQDAELPVFDVEYALDQADTAYERSLARGFVPYCTRRSLSRLTTTPPPAY